MSDKPYYLAYEKRYQAVYDAGVDRWGHYPDDETLTAALTQWVDAYTLAGKRVVEYACGEGACGEILSRLGVIYHGVDIAPSAVEKSRRVLSGYPSATVEALDMVNRRVEGVFDAALDSMGFHMLVTDADRAKYLKNAFDALAAGAPMLFFRQSYSEKAFDGAVPSMDEWLAVSKDDYATLHPRTGKNAAGDDVEVRIPNVPARARNKRGYLEEMARAGFVVDDFVEMDLNNQCPYSASIYVHKPQDG